MPSVTELMARAGREITLLREALETIAASSIPDQPAAAAGDELTWAQQHVASLRRIARNAVAESTARNADL